MPCNKRTGDEIGADISKWQCWDNPVNDYSDNNCYTAPIVPPISKSTEVSIPKTLTGGKRDLEQFYK